MNLNIHFTFWKQLHLKQILSASWHILKLWWLHLQSNKPKCDILFSGSEAAIHCFWLFLTILQHFLNLLRSLQVKLRQLIYFLQENMKCWQVVQEHSLIHSHNLSSCNGMALRTKGWKYNRHTYVDIRHWSWSTTLILHRRSECFSQNWIRSHLSLQYTYLSHIGPCWPLQY